ncbi:MULTISPECIES: DNA sulfur modification protein DndE [Marinobacter]|uniref:DNA sulfur modification protein DndE n=1 Tax=Marinobacter TaxID=2742 RepID=UPI003B436DEB|nr:DNA sulfur modification protein DndE [Marinobacter alkaliphilus]
MIDRVRLTATAKNQLSVLKRRTGIQHYNSLCRHALCLSLKNESPMPQEDYDFSNGLEIDWQTLAGSASTTLTNLVLMDLHVNNYSNDVSPKALAVMHIHRGLSYLLSQNESYISDAL